MRAVFVDANAVLEGIARRLHAGSGDSFEIAFGGPGIAVDALPECIGDAEIAVVDHTALPVAVARRCPKLRHVVFLGTGVRSYMDPEALAAVGIGVDIIKGYGDTAVAEHAIALMFAAARRVAEMDRGIRAGEWLRSEGVQLTGKTIGLIGYGGIGAETARLALGIGMRVLAWNRRAVEARRDVAFVPIETLLAESDVVSMHLLLCDETRGFLSRERISAMKPGAILVNTARGALVDEAAMVEALATGRLGHAALDVFDVEPLPAGHVLTTLSNVTLTAHSGFRTPEANERLIEAALVHCRRHAASASPSSRPFASLG